jgi:hypothetical protein
MNVVPVLFNKEYSVSCIPLEINININVCHTMNG